MAQRLELQQALIDLLGSTNVYFQPPTNIVMKYPCIVYHRGTGQTRFADDKPYKYAKSYVITVIDRDPDSPIPDKVAKLPTCVHDRFFTADDLNHDVFRLFW